jgi:hypothetical protein
MLTGGSVACKKDGCNKKAKTRGLCWAHGGGTKCRNVQCTKVAVSNGFCWAHGGGKRCVYNDCKKPAYKRTCNLCEKHFVQLRDGNEVQFEWCGERSCSISDGGADLQQCTVSLRTS